MKQGLDQDQSLQSRQHGPVVVIKAQQYRAEQRDKDVDLGQTDGQVHHACPGAVVVSLPVNQLLACIIV